MSEWLFSPFSESEMDRENRLERESGGEGALEEVLGEMQMEVQGKSVQGIV